MEITREEYQEFIKAGVMLESLKRLYQRKTVIMDDEIATITGWEKVEEVDVILKGENNEFSLRL